MNNTLKYLVPAFVLGCWMACGKAKQQRVSPANSGRSEADMREALIHQNKDLINEEIEAIQAFTDRRGWQMDTTSTGLRFSIREQTSGRPARLMKDVTISFTASLLNGTLCYSSDSSGTLTFTLGQSDLPSGLQEGILKMKEGEKALIIVPSYLAYGISGDGICIPGSSSILYEVKLEKVSEQ
ncbi:MAG: FKBP-type peptidyl-prolyl cis-trans isomerase [Bacteroidia bacterium]|nr:FKBP-type peptidyl-prolyl cis-trans isomerase [Bacteroidia bacterium]